MKLYTLILLTAILFTDCQDEFTLDAKADNFFHVKRENYYLPVRVRGNTASKKILLYIQGGPGNNTLDFAEVDYPKWRGSLEKDYAIAYYDQLGTGNRIGKFDYDDITLDNYLQDIHTIATVLKNKYDADVFLFGHSFGGYLAYAYAMKYKNEGVPVGYISFHGPATTDSDNLRWTFRWDYLHNLAEKFNAENVYPEFWTEVAGYLNDHPVLQTDEEKRQWNNYVIASIGKGVDVSEDDLPVPSVLDYLNVTFTSSYNVLTSNINLKVLDKVSTKLINEAKAFLLINKLSEIESPILLITGEYDDICPSEEMNFTLESIASSNKQLVIIKDAAHDSYLQNPDVFNEAVRNFVNQF